MATDSRSEIASRSQIHKHLTVYASVGVVGLLLVSVFAYAQDLRGLCALALVSAVGFIAVALFKARRQISQLEIQVDALRNERPGFALDFSSFEGTEEALIIADESGVIHRINHAACEMFGHLEEAILGENLTKLMPAEIAAVHQTYLEKFLRSGESRIIGVGRRLTAMRSSGEEFSIWLSVSHFEHEGRHYFTGSIGDLSWQQETECSLVITKSALVQVQQQLIEAQKLESLATLSGGIAHDFNNILATMVGHTELTLDDIADLDCKRQTQENLQNVVASGRRGERLVQQLLAFGRCNPEADSSELIDVGAVVKESLELMRATMPKTILLETEIREELDRVQIPADRIHQIMANLFSNSADAIGSEHGKITVSVDKIDGGNHSHSNGDPGSRIRLRVSDTGEGMDEKTQSMLFDPFFTSKPVGRGTGLGLSVVHGIVTQAGGEIVVESSLGGGTTFEILFPSAGKQVAL